MDKIKLEIKTPENKTIEYNGTKIEIIPFIDFSEQIFLIRNYIECCFGNSQEILIERPMYHILESECRLINHVLQLNTNIDMNVIDNNIYADSVLWGTITNEIVNWKEFRKRLDSVIDEIKEQEKLNNSLGKVLSNLLEKGEDLINKLSNISPDKIEELQESGKELIEELEKSSILKNPSDLHKIAAPIIGEPEKKE